MANSTLIWITGASAGIGAALAASVPFADASVVDVSRSGGAAGTEHLPADLADPAAWGLVEAHLLARLGGGSAQRAVFVHSAGTIEPIGFAGAVDSAAYTRNALLNAAAPLALGHAFLRAVAGFAGEAHLLLLTSGAATHPYEGWSGYNAGKAAVDQWVRTAGAEQCRRANAGLPACRVVAVAPGVTETGMQRIVRSTDPADFPELGKFRSLHEQGKLRAPEDVARDLWGLLDYELDNGAVVDLRDLA